MTLKLSVLDQSLARSADQAANALQETLQMAQWCEQLGYERFWVSEHHAFPAVAGSAPEVLLDRRCIVLNLVATHAVQFAGQVPLALRLLVHGMQQGDVAGALLHVATREHVLLCRGHHFGRKQGNHFGWKPRHHFGWQPFNCLRSDRGFGL